MVSTGQTKGIHALGKGLAVSSLVSTGFAGALHSINIPITVILPTTAPIWVGFATMIFMLLKEP